MILEAAREYWHNLPTSPESDGQVRKSFCFHHISTDEVAGICKKLGVEVEILRQGIGSDPRIGPKFLYPGYGYGGSCFPKDVKALIYTAKQAGFDPEILQAVEARNTRQKRVLFEKLQAHFGNLKGKTIAIWGLAFKPDSRKRLNCYSGMRARMGRCQ